MTDADPTGVTRHMASVRTGLFIAKRSAGLLVLLLDAADRRFEASESVFDWNSFSIYGSILKRKPQLNLANMLPSKQIPTSHSTFVLEL
jgi:hypothetical protein